MIDFDVILEELGAFGKYQILAFISLSYFSFCGGLISVSPVFTAYVPEYKCLMPFDDSKNNNLTFDEKLNLTTPLDEDGDPEDPCVRYGYNTTSCTVNDDLSCVNESEPVVQCEEFYYDDDLFTNTVITEFDLVCEKYVIYSFTLSMYMIGILVGAAIFGYVCDRFGRRIAVLITGIGMLLTTLGVATSRSVEGFTVWRIFQGMFVSGCNISAFSHIMEIVGNQWRTFAGIAYQIFFVLGYMALSGICYAYRDWHQMQIGMFVLSSPFAVFVLITPESARWLFASGREKEGKKIVNTMARLNNVEIPLSTWIKAENTTQDGISTSVKRKYSTIDLFRYKGLRKVTLNLGFNWAVNNMVYYGILLSAGSLAGNIFLNNIYGGIFEMSSYIICILIMDHVGRRLLLIVTLTGSGIALICSTIVNEYAEDDKGLITLGLVLAFIGKGLVSGSYAVIYNFTGELLPTVVRGKGFGFCSICARISGVLCPYIIGIGTYISWLPNFIFGLMAIVGGLFSFFFRDTTGHDMMETVEEAELFYAGKIAPRKDGEIDERGPEDFELTSM